MIIAIDCRLYIHAPESPVHWASLYIDYVLATDNAHQWILLLNKPNTHLEGLQLPNVKTILCGKPVTHAAARAWWYDYTLPAVLKKHNVELLLGMYGYISLKTKVPQWLWLHDVKEPLLHDPLAGWSTIWYRQRLSQMLHKATVILDDYPARISADPVFLKADSSKRLIHSGRFPVPVPTVPVEQELDCIKQQLSEGKEYFLCLEGWQQEKQGVDLLLSFSAFKKRMQTGMKLILVGLPKDKSGWEEKLRTYRYRNDVKMLENIPAGITIGSLIAAAYGLLHLPQLPNTNALLLAMQVGTPAIVNEQAIWQQVAADTVLYYEQAAPKAQIATWLMLLYKDEKRRQELIAQAREIARRNDGAAFAQKLLTQIAEKV